MFRRKAKWIYWREDGNKRCKCSNCKTSYGCIDTPYCPNCGRKMRSDRKIYDTEKEMLEHKIRLQVEKDKALFMIVIGVMFVMIGVIEIIAFVTCFF